MHTRRLHILFFTYSVITLLIAGLYSCDKKNSSESDPPEVTPITTFRNPLLTSGPDPWVIQKGNFYYYTHTLGNRIAIWKTAKVSDLKTAPSQTILSAPVTGPNSKNVWAPELHFLDNKWYAYYTAGSTMELSTQRTFVLENSNEDPLTGTWTEKGQIGDPAANVFAIDGTTFSYNEKNYFLWSGHETGTDSSQHIFIAQMANPWTLATARQKISSPTYDWEKKGAPPAINEAPQILKGPTGKVFLLFSASGCWTDDYALGMLALKDGGNPLSTADWIKSPTPVFTKNTSGGVFGPGHNSFFKSLDGTEDWILYHANPTAGQGCGDLRNPRMQKFSWNANGTPNFSSPVSIYVPLQKPSGE
jgi:GH43 family beta-xylosidase